ncbi:MAG: glycosyltransferase family 4 protein [Solirubrobacteraceae bacterium]
MTQPREAAHTPPARPLRIAVVEPLPVGGLLHYATQLADALAERGNDVELILARENELAAHRGAARRRDILPAETAPLPSNPTRLQSKLRRARNAARLLATWARVAREVRSSDHDVVLINANFDMALTAGAGLLVTGLKGRTPVAHVCHNVRPLNRWSAGELYVSSKPTLALLARLYPSFDLVFVHGERNRTQFEATWPPTKLQVIPHGDEGLFTDDPPPQAEEPRILFFGAWSKMKGLPVLMQAFDELSARMPDARLTIAGPTVSQEGEADRVLAWARQRLGRVETLPGYVPIEDVPALFTRARVVVLPYVTSSQSGVVHLAMTMRRAVVVTDVGALPEAVSDGVSGLVVPPTDPAALAGALQRVLEDPDLAESFGEAGRARALEGSGWATVAEQVETGLRSLSGERP